MREITSSMRDLHASEFERLLDEAFDAAFEAGEWRSDDEEEYAKVHAVFVEKKHAAFAAIHRLVSPQDHGAAREAALENMAFLALLNAHRAGSFSPDFADLEAAEKYYCENKKPLSMGRQWLDHERRKARAVLAVALKADTKTTPGPVEDGWQPIETAPKDKTIDLWRRGPTGKMSRVCDLKWSNVVVAWCNLDSVVLPDAATHWRYQPAPPSQPPQQIGEQAEPQGGL